MIIEAINDNELKGKVYKKGTQKNVTDAYGKFLVEMNQNWKYIKGAQLTDEEQKFYADLSADNDKSE